MEFRNAQEIRQAVAAMVSGSAEALDRLVWTGVFGGPEVRDLARTAVMDQCRSVGRWSV